MIKLNVEVVKDGITVSGADFADNTYTNDVSEALEAVALLYTAHIVKGDADAKVTAFRQAFKDAARNAENLDNDDILDMLDKI